MYQLLLDTSMGAATCIKRVADSAFIPFDPANGEYQAYLKWLADGNEPLPADVPPLPPVDPKMTGVDFGGVMCSATSADAAGLLQVKAGIEMMGASFKTQFVFSNGNSLLLTAANFVPFMKVWVPFRQAFFAPSA